MLEDERNLITQAIGGETEAFGRLYDHYLPMIYRFILLKVGQREEAEDLTHQVFLKAWQNIGSKYSDEGLPFSSWLYRIARNTVIDHYRRSRPTIEIEENDTREELISHPDIISRMDIEKGAKEALEAIKKLGETDRNIIIMRFVEDLSVKEVAEALGKTEGAVKVAQHRALEKIKKILASNG
ncbi:MAG: sigma-70 family RNA polymerase sigma factor [Candidatus Colwellbacteria bacterium]|nr:sigma-70 family RNA polymerase sigma factor [Candidatus Colwellbacteria bacterium]